MKIPFIRNRGFTLIELLVVISIIGILSAIILAALGSARLKGKSGAIQSEMIQVRNFMELNKDSSGAYTGAFNYLTAGNPTFPLGAGVGYYKFASPTDCTNYISSTGVGTQLRNICSDIVANGGTMNIGGPGTALNDSTWTKHATYSIEALLLSTNTYSCLGSNGGNSSGNSSDDYTHSGCLANP